MRLIINLMIFAGSALMVYNILRYGLFVRDSQRLEQINRKLGLLVVPLLLLIFFLVGYIVVGLSRIADLMIAGILFGGSVFVFLLLMVMFSIIDRLRSTDKVLSTRYEEMQTELHALTKGASAVFLVNLTADRILERAGDYLYDTDIQFDTYSEMLKARSENVIETGNKGTEESLFGREALLRCYQEGQTSVSERLLVRRRDGETVYVRLEASLSTMPVSNDVIAFITELPNNEEIVRKALMEDVLMDQYDWIAYLIDGKYRVVISNAGKKKGLLFPDDEEDSYESLYLNYILPAQAKGRRTEGPNPLRLSVIDKALAGNRVYEVDAPFFLEGEERYKHISFYRIDSKVKFYLMLVSDSTAIQEEQRAQNQKLSDLLDEALQASQSRTRFFSRVSHDIRTPLNGILGFTNLAKSEDDPRKRGEYLDKVELSGKQLLSMIEDLIAMSLIESDKLRLEKEPTDLLELGKKLRDRFVTERQEKGITFRLETDGLRDSVVLCDGKRLGSALTRLLENSYAYVPQGESVSLAIRQLDSGNPQTGVYVFVIRNCGVEIPQDILEHIFEVQSWDENEKTEELPGVGLGMNVAKAFIDRMGGTIAVRNAEDSVTEFSIRLEFPLVSAVKVDDSLPAATDRMKLNILLVDDNPINREIAELMLTAEGWTVEQAENGAQAVEMVSASDPGHFDLVLMDVQMPVMNGYEATARIRALREPQLASVPIIAVTANAYQEDSNEAFAAGVDGYVTKPIDPDSIRKAIDKTLTKGDRK
ncbi:MAG: response regulator [Oscillospiraceae bacterium]|nr:response regulator [Oscillospiraceae bacterium]